MAVRHEIAAEDLTLWEVSQYLLGLPFSAKQNRKVTAVEFDARLGVLAFEVEAAAETAD